VRQVLAALFDSVGDWDDVRPVWFVRDGIVYVASNYSRPELRAEVRVYDVRDIMLKSAPFVGKFPPTTRTATMLEYSPVVVRGSEQDIVDQLIRALAAGDVRFEGQYEGQIESAHYFAGRIFFRATPEGHRRVVQRLSLLRGTEK
jgi:hypothetical protein